MIKLEKTNIPEVLRQNSANWLYELKEAIAEGDKKKISTKRSRYNHKAIKDAVRAETSGKCAYCEAEVVAVAHGDIEHVFPKSLKVERTFDWDNLGFACQVCNQNKSDKDPEFQNIIDPYVVDPEPFIRFFGAFISANGTAEGLKTIYHLKLDRVELFERRQTLLRHLIKHFEMIQMAGSAQEKEILIEDFEANELGATLEFSALRRDFWAAYKPR